MGGAVASAVAVLHALAGTEAVCVPLTGALADTAEVAVAAPLAVYEGDADAH